MLSSPMNDLDWPEAMREEAIRRAEQLGHTVGLNPSAEPAAVECWTCTICGDAVLFTSAVICGAATTRHCGSDHVRY